MATEDNGDQTKIERILASIGESAEKTGGIEHAHYRGVYSIAYVIEGQPPLAAVKILTRADILKWHNAVVEARYASDKGGKELTWAEAFAATPWPESRAE